MALLITYKALDGLTPQYISDLLSLYDPACTLRSSGRGLLSVPDSRLKTKGDRAFEVRALRLWNTLPEEIWQATSVLSNLSLKRTLIVPPSLISSDLSFCSLHRFCHF